MKPRGFTIIETMIALAIGSLILSMVLLMLPALRRNGANNQRKQDVASILSSVSHYQLSHSGNFPPDFAAISTTKLSFYDSANVDVHPVTPSAGMVKNNSDIASDDSVSVFNYMVCDRDNARATSQGAGYRSVVALYRIESAGGYAFQCQDL